MKDAALEGYEIDQKLMESLNVGNRFGFSPEKLNQLPLYEAREKLVNELYKVYKHLVVTPEDEVYGCFQDGKYQFIKNAPGLYNSVEQAKI